MAVVRASPLLLLLLLLAAALSSLAIPGHAQLAVRSVVTIAGEETRECFCSRHPTRFLRQLCDLRWWAYDPRTDTFTVNVCQPPRDPRMEGQFVGGFGRGSWQQIMTNKPARDLQHPPLTENMRDWLVEGGRALADVWYMVTDKNPAATFEADWLAVDRGIIHGDIRAFPEPYLSAVSPRLPLVSCLMVTDKRLWHALRAIYLFQQQTYANRELVIVSKNKATVLELEHVLQRLEDPRIRLIPILASSEEELAQITLGDQRNFAVKMARGEYVATWDDDDIYDPERLAVQMQAIVRFDSVMASTLARTILWQSRVWPPTLHVGGVWHSFNTLLCRKSVMPEFGALETGEDTVVLHALFQSQRMVMVDSPLMYWYVHHGNNTVTEEMFGKFCGNKSAVLKGKAAMTLHGEMLRRTGLVGPQAEVPASHPLLAWPRLGEQSSPSTTATTAITTTTATTKLINNEVGVR